MHVLEELSWLLLAVVEACSLFNGSEDRVEGYCGEYKEDSPQCEGYGSQCDASRYITLHSKDL